MITQFIKNYLRVHTKNNSISILNLLGLTLGILSSLFIFTWLSYQDSFDKFHENSEEIFQVMNGESTTQLDGWGTSPSGSILTQTRAEIENFTRIYVLNNLEYFTLKYQEKRFIEPKLCIADPSFFQVFSFEFTKGNPENAFTQPNSLVMTEEVAKRYFGDEDALGKIIYLNNRPLEVTGILKNLPKNSHIQFDLLIPTSFLQNQQILDSWNEGFITYVLAKQNLEENFWKQNAFFEEVNQIATLKNKSQTYHDLLPLKEIYLSNQDINSGFIYSNSKHFEVMGYILIALIVITLINFSHLTTLQTIKRSKELSIRRINGASLSRIVIQMMVEVQLSTFIAFTLSLIFFIFLFPLFAQLTGIEIVSISLTKGLITTKTVTAIISLSIFGVLSSILPIFILIRVNIIQVFKGDLAFSQTGTQLQKPFVISQFILATLLVTMAFLVFLQNQWVQHKNLGYDQEQLIYISKNGELAQYENYKGLKEELLKLASVEGVSVSVRLPTQEAFFEPFYKIQGISEELNIQTEMVGADFFHTLNIQFIEGQGFKNESIEGKKSFIFNQEAIDQLQLQNPIGLEITDSWIGTGEVAGWVENHFSEPLYYSLKPKIYINEFDFSNFILIRYQSENIEETISAIRSIFDQNDWEHLFNYHFLDDEFDKVYQTEKMTGNLLLLFSSLALSMSMIGFICMVSFQAERRKKEISIRKVFGSSGSAIFKLLLLNFLRPIATAFIISLPLTNFFISEWLKSFAYKTHISWWLFSIPLFLVLLTALLSTFSITLKSATTQPIIWLRRE